MPNNPSCYITYTWEDDTQHQSWVLDLAKRVKGSGVVVRIDKWNTNPGDDMAHFMESGIRDSDFVIIVCTPTYAKQSNEGTGGAGYEKRLITGELLNGKRPSKFIPIIRKGPIHDALPSFLKASKYIDFREDSLFQTRLRELLDDLHGAPKPGAKATGGFRMVQSTQRAPSPTKVANKPLELPPPLDMALKLPTYHDPITYCARCGVFPGRQTQCVGLSSVHDFKTSVGTIYCACCGQSVGTRSDCTRALSVIHEFKSGEGSEYCRRCGVKAGRQTVCTGLSTCHDFVQEPSGKVTFHFNT